MTQLKPLGGRVLVKRSEAELTKGGIYLPETAQKKPQMGVVVAVGSGKMDEKGQAQGIDISVGSKVYFSSYAGNEVKVGNEEDYLILNEDDILCLIES